MCQLQETIYNIRKNKLEMIQEIIKVLKRSDIIKILNELNVNKLLLLQETNSNIVYYKDELLR